MAEDMDDFGFCGDDEDEGLYCDYDVGEFCEDPQTKAAGLCTTECAAYLRACQEENKRE